MMRIRDGNIYLLPQMIRRGGRSINYYYCWCWFVSCLLVLLKGGGGGGGDNEFIPSVAKSEYIHQYTHQKHYYYDYNHS